MNKMVLDIFICLSFLASIFLLYRAWRKEKMLFGLLAILALAAVLRIYLAKDPYLHHWDERYHALVAKNMTHHPLTPTLYENPVLPYDELNWVGSHLWLSKPPVPLWAMSSSIVMFGANEWAIRLPSLLLSLLAVYVTFLLGKRLFGEKVGLLAAALHAIHGLLIELVAGRVSSDHVETFFVIFVEVAIYFVVLSLDGKRNRQYIFLAGLFTGLAFLSKWFPAFVVFPVWFTAFVFSKPFSWKTFFVQGSILVLSCALLILPWIWQVNILGDNILERVLFAFNEPIQDHHQPLFYYWHQVMIIFGELIYLPLGFAVYCAIKRKWTRQQMLLLAWIVIPLVVFTLGGTKRHTYLLIAAPAFFLITAQLFVFLSENYALSNTKWLNIIVMVLLLGLPLRYSTERLKLFYEEAPLEQFYLYRDNWENRFDENDLVFGCSEYVELMFYTEVKAAYEGVPESAILQQLREQGYDLYFYREGDFLTEEDYFSRDR